MRLISERKKKKKKEGTQSCIELNIYILEGKRDKTNVIGIGKIHYGIRVSTYYVIQSTYTCLFVCMYVYVYVYL